MKLATRILTVILLLFLGISAMVGGIMLVADPAGGIIGMPAELLIGTPFNNYLIPGIILIAANGLLSLAIAVLAIRSSRNYHLLAILQGIILAGWLSAELVINPAFYVPVLHISLFTIAILMVICGYTLGRLDKKSRLRGKLKGLFFLLRADRLVPAGIFHFFASFADLSRWIAKNSKCDFNDFYSFGFDYSKRELLYEHIKKTCIPDGAIDYLEFGVSKGSSFRWWIERIKNEEARFYGFDTFSGLPEDWGPFRKGDMDNGNEPPQIDDHRHTFYQGLFQQTLIPFLKSYIPGRRKVIHMDADLYSSTLYVLTLLTPILSPGDIIMFDEFNVPRHEYKAFREWSDSFYIEYRVLGGVNNFYQVAIMIE